MSELRCSIWWFRLSGHGSISIGSSSPVSRSSLRQSHSVFPFLLFFASSRFSSCFGLALQPIRGRTHTHLPSPFFSMCLRRQGRGSRDLVLGFTYQEVWPAKLCRLRARPLPKNLSRSHRAL